ncbi:hypothetical protein [Mesorhizobium sp.]|uniref:IS66 family transposase n=1 Tax=Mesorhizobium sp. TaxID=1871066 RepID=UPI0011F87002|nr:MAG: hypothetical protein E5W96_15555 [Mesorhizobium sp.]
MSLATAELPSDPDALRAFAAALQAELYAKTLHIEKLKAQLATLRRARFGQSSEKLDRPRLGLRRRARRGLLHPDPDL